MWVNAPKNGRSFWNIRPASVTMVELKVLIEVHSAANEVSILAAYLIGPE